MLRANIFQIFIADISYNKMVDYFKNLNQSLVKITDNELLFEKDNTLAKFELNYHEEDSFTKTYLTNLDDGTTFRVIRPVGVSKEISLIKNNSKDGFSVGSINPDGYSVAFLLTERNDIRNTNIIIKGVDEHLQKLATGAIMALQNNLHNDFYSISRRLIAGINSNKKNIHELEFGSQIAEILKDNKQLYDELEQKIIINL